MRSRSEIAKQAGPVPIRPWITIAYDTHLYPFAEIISSDIFKVPHLHHLHRYAQNKILAQGGRRNLREQDNISLRNMLQRVPDDCTFYRLYHSFMLNVLARLVGRSLSYSSHPKMRVHLPGTDSVSSFHHDIIVTRRTDQINFWMPFTNVEGTATLWLESHYGGEDFSPVPLRYGQVLIFDGGYLGHGTVANASPATRISCDMRFSYKGARGRIDGVDLMNRIIRRIDAKGLAESNESGAPEEGVSI